MTQFMLEPGRWYGLVEFPAAGKGMGASPILLKSVNPLKSGKGLVALSFLRPMLPRSGGERHIVVRVMDQRGIRLIGMVEDHPRQQAVIFSDLDECWMNDWLGDLRRRRPTAAMSLVIDGQALGGADFNDVLAQLFGTSHTEILEGAQPTSSRCNQRGKPRHTETVPFSRTLDPFDSWLAARGFVPREMEEKWFIHRSGDDRMHFRRSWTGHLVYDVALTWHGPNLVFSDFEVSRDPDQYQGSDAGYEREVLNFLIDAILLGRPSAFPLDPAGSGNPLEAWAVAGSQG